MKLLYKSGVWQQDLVLHPAPSIKLASLERE